MIILDTRNPFAILTVLAIVIAVAFGFWSFISSSEKFADINYQKDLWSEKEPNSYSYSIFNGCMFVQKSEAVVLLGKTVFRKVDEDGHKINGNVKLEDLFSTVDRAQAHAHTIEVNYSKTYGYPESIKVDWNKNIMDDECFYVVKNFKDLG